MHSQQELWPQGAKNCFLGGTKNLTLFFFLKDRIYLFLERAEGKEKDRERNINVWLPLAQPRLGTQTMCPEWESNQRPFGLEADSQSPEPHQPGQNLTLFMCKLQRSI